MAEHQADRQHDRNNRKPRPPIHPARGLTPGQETKHLAQHAPSTGAAFGEVAAHGITFVRLEEL